MEEYNGQITNSSDRNFASSFRGNSCFPISEERHPVHQDGSGIGCFSSRPQASFPRYDEQSQGSPARTNMRNSAQNTFFRPEPGYMPQFSNNGMSHTSDFSSESVAAGSTIKEENMNPTPEYDNWSRSARSEFNGQNMYDGPDMWNRNINTNSDFPNRGKFPKTDFNSVRGMSNRTQISRAFARPSESGLRSPMSSFQRPQVNSGPRPAMNGVAWPPMNVVLRPSLNGITRLPRDGIGSPQMNGVAMSPMGGICIPQSDGACRPPMNALGRPHVNNDGNRFFRPQMNSASTFPRPPVNNGVILRPQFNGNPMNRMAHPPPQMQFCNGETSQRHQQSFDWNQGANSFTRHKKFIRPGDSWQHKPFAILPQSKPAFKPERQQQRKNDVFLPELKAEGNTMKPWMTDELYAEVKKKNEMYARAKAANSDEMWQEFKLQRNKVSSLIKEAKLKNGFTVRKKKVAKEDDSTAKPFSCDTCDRAFAVESKLEEHIKEHMKCGVEGCQFEAHPKIVELHKRMQHDTGYAAMISKLGDVAEIEKWRQQRKSHFPTSENVKKRQAEQAEKIARGEVLETKDFGKFKKQKPGGQDDSRNSQTSANWKSRRGRKRQRNRRQKRGNGFSAEDAKAMESLLGDSVSDSDDESHIRLHKFTGTVNSADTQDSYTSVQGTEASQKIDFSHTGVIKSGTMHCTSIQDFSQEAHSEGPLCITIPDPQTLSLETEGCEFIEEFTTSKAQSHYQAKDFLPEPGHLSCIVSGQEVNGVKSAGDDDGPAVEPVVKEIETTCCVVDLSESPEVAVVDDDDDGPSVEPVLKEVETTCVTDLKQASLDDTKPVPKSTKNTQLKSRAKKIDKNRNSGQSRKLNGESTQVKNNTLLEKLLADEIRHERNVILQCIRYTLNNNFFGVAGQRASKS